MVEKKISDKSFYFKRDECADLIDCSFGNVGPSIVIKRHFTV